MIRVVSDNGSVALGFVRGPLLDRLMAGERVCLDGFVDPNGLLHPHVCLFVRDSNEELLVAAGEYFPDGVMAGAALVHASKEEPK